MFFYNSVGPNPRALRMYLAEKHLSLPTRDIVADVILYCALDFGSSVGQPIPQELARITAWFARVGARPSAAASLHPTSEQIGFRG